MIKQIELHSKTLLCLTQSHRFVSLLWNIRTFFWFGKCPFNFPIYMTPVEDILQTRKNVSFELWIFKIPFFCLFPTEQHIASLPLKYISNKRHKCLGSKDSLLFGRKCVFYENKMFIKHYYEHWTSSGNKLLQWPLDTTWAHSQQNIWFKEQS